LKKNKKIPEEMINIFRETKFCSFLKKMNHFFLQSKQKNKEKPSILSK